MGFGLDLGLGLGLGLGGKQSGKTEHGWMSVGVIGGYWGTMSKRRGSRRAWVGSKGLDHGSESMK